MSVALGPIHVGIRGEYAVFFEDYGDNGTVLYIGDSAEWHGTPISLVFESPADLRAFAERILAAVPACDTCLDDGTDPLGGPCDSCHGYPTPTEALIQAHEVTA